MMKMDIEPPPFLPEEIITNILICLPVKSLIRFQSVCKQWKSIIQSQSFIAEHLDHSTHQDLSVLLGQNPLSFCLLDSKLQVRKVHTTPLLHSFVHATIVGSCNGLLCVQIDDHDYKFPPSFMLWNPAIREFRCVPARTHARSDVCMVGFGFSPVVNDYKIVRTYAKCRRSVNRVEVFSLSRGSWEGIDVGNLEGINLHPVTGSVSVNGAIFWVGSKKVKEDGTDHVAEDIPDEVYIVSFDIAKEVFTLIPIPDSGGLCAFEKLAVYGNKLALICDLWEVDSNMYRKRCGATELWVLEEGTCEPGKRWATWIKIFTTTSSFPGRILLPVTVWRNQLVCKSNLGRGLDKGMDRLYLWDITTSEVKSFDVATSCCVHNICSYAESLVSPGPYR